MPLTSTAPPPYLQPTLPVELVRSRKAMELFVSHPVAWMMVDSVPASPPATVSPGRKGCVTIPFPWTTRVGISAVVGLVESWVMSTTPDILVCGARMESVPCSALE